MAQQTRRDFFAAAAVVASPPRSEFVRYLDPLTETIIVRLTTPTSTALLPAAQNRAVSSRDRFLVFSSDRTGRFVPYRLDLRTGVLVALASPAHLDPASLTMDLPERTLYYLDGTTLCQYSFAAKRSRTIADGIAAFRIQSERIGFFALINGKLQNQSAHVLASDVSSLCALSPDGAWCLFRRGQPDDPASQLCAVSTAAPAPVRLLATGVTADPYWSADSQSVLFLRDRLIRQVSLASNAEASLAPDTPLASFSPNQDDSVFVGASGSHAQPAVLLVLRGSRRELVLCEHRASRPNQVAPIFSPDSHRVYFQSDRDGHMSLYSVNTELLLEKT